MSDLFPITDVDKLACVKRELQMRQGVYARRVAALQMSPETAEREIALMKAIVEDYESNTYTRIVECVDDWYTIAGADRTKARLIEHLKLWFKRPAGSTP